MSNNIERYKIKAAEKWREIGEQIPYLTFPQEWEVQMFPPFGGAVVRFRARLKGAADNDKNWVSVYLDFYDNLGFMNQPYWEAYPIGDDTARFLLNETKDLIETIDRQLKGEKHVASA